MNKPLLIGIIAFLAINFATFYFPIEVYNGETVYTNGNTLDEKLSLSYLLKKEEIIASIGNPDLVDIRLTTMGWVFVFLLNVLLPFWIGFRFKLFENQRVKRKE